MAGGGDAGVGDHEDPADVVLGEVVADLVGRALAELQTWCAVREHRFEAHAPNLTAGPIPRAAVTSPETGTCPASMSDTGVQATASVVPSGSRTAGSPSADRGREHQVHPVEVLLATVRGGAGEVLVVHSEELADRRGQAALLRDLASDRRSRSLAVVDPAARQAPGRPGAGRGPSCGSAGRRRRAAPVRTPRAAAGWPGGAAPAPRAPSARSGPSPTRHRPPGASGRRRWSPRPRRPAARERRRAPRRRTRSARSAAREAPSSPWLPVSRWRWAEPIQSGRPSSQLRPVSSCTSRTTAASGCSPKSIPPPGSVHCSFSEIDGAIRASRMSPPRTIKAYAATRWRRGSCVGSSDMGGSLGGC